MEDKYKPYAPSAGRADKHASNTTPFGPPTVSESNASKWNAPGGGYDQWKKGDAAREKALPPGAPYPTNPPAALDRPK